MCDVGFWNVEVGVDNGELGTVLERMVMKAELKEQTAQSPNVTRCVDGIVGPRVNLEKKPRNGKIQNIS